MTRIRVICRGREPVTVKLRVAVAVVVAAALVGLVAACGAVKAAAPEPGSVAGPSALSATRVTISETGSGLLYPIAHTWAGAYHQVNPAVTVTTASTGSGTGIADASGGQANIGASDAYLSSGDLVKNPTLLNIPLVVSAQTVIYNLPGLSAHLHVRLNGTVLAEIYRGKITRWDDQAIEAVNPGIPLPSLTIVPVHRSDSSGDTFLFTSYLSTQDPSWDTLTGYGTTAAWPHVAGAVRATGSVATVQACEAKPGCVAYNGISYLSQARSGGLGEAEVANADGHYLLPTSATIAAAAAAFTALTPPGETISMIDGPAAGGYPIVNYEYAVVSTRQPSAGQASAVREFLRWILAQGNAPSYVGAVGFDALSPALVSLGEQQIARIGS
jgi:phosphate transport system substrate-binding protein